MTSSTPTPSPSGQNYEDGDLRIWHIPQVPGISFRVAVRSLEEGYLLLDVLADYDWFQYHQKIKPDFSNACGIERRVDGHWEDVEDGELQDYVPRSEDRKQAHIDAADA
jgi:hypothetical protein